MAAVLCTGECLGIPAPPHRRPVASPVVTPRGVSRRCPMSSGGESPLSGHIGEFRPGAGAARGNLRAWEPDQEYPGPTLFPPPTPLLLSPGLHPARSQSSWLHTGQPPRAPSRVEEGSGQRQAMISGTTPVTASNHERPLPVTQRGDISVSGNHELLF